jgi:hypothetical protein
MPSIQEWHAVSAGVTCSADETSVKYLLFDTVNDHEDLIIVSEFIAGLLLNYLQINPLNAELNPICHLLELLGSHHIPHISRIRVKATSSGRHAIKFIVFDIQRTVHRVIF